MNGTNARRQPRNKMISRRAIPIGLAFGLSILALLVAPAAGAAPSRSAGEQSSARAARPADTPGVAHQ